MFSIVHRIKDRETVELLVESLESHRRLRAAGGENGLRTARSQD
jgi:hypothetical protein